MKRSLKVRKIIGSPIIYTPLFSSIYKSIWIYLSIYQYKYILAIYHMTVMYPNIGMDVCYEYISINISYLYISIVSIFEFEYVASLS